MRHPIAGLVIAVMVAGCGAGSPQNEAVRTEQSLSAWPIQTTSDEARQELTEGLRELDMAQGVEAVTHLQRATAADPNLAIGWLLLHMAAGDVLTTKEADAALKKAEALAPTARPVERELILSMRKAMDNDADGAVAEAQKAVKLDATSPRAWVWLGDMYGITDATKAREAYGKAIEIAPGFAPAYLARAVSYMTRDPIDNAKAEPDARKAVELLPNEAHTHDVLGDALRAQGKLEEAAQQYTQQADLDPTRGDGYQQRAHVNSFLGKYAEARADYDAAVSTESSPDRKLGLGMYRAFVHLYEKNPRAAVDELERLYQSVDAMKLSAPLEIKDLLATNQAFIASVSKLPAAAGEAKRYTENARAMIAQVNSPEFTRSKQSDIALVQGYAALAQNDYAGATQKAHEYMNLRHAERNATRDRPAHDLLGLVAMDQKRYADAVHEFEQGVPESAYTKYQQAVALDALGRPAEAQTQYKKVAGFFFNNVGNAIVHNDAAAKVKQAI